MPPASTPPTRALPPIPGGPPNRPPPPIPGGPPNRAPPAAPNGAAGINGLGGASANMARQFLAGPKAFMLAKGVQTETQAVTQVVTASTVASANNFVWSPTAVDDPYDVTINHKQTGPVVRYMRFDDPIVGQGNKTMLRLFAAPGPGLLPVYWLPWQPKSIMETTIPAIPAGADVNDYDTYPKYFFTAGLSGCSIFVKGPRSSPTVYHAGVEIEKIQGSSGRFWKEQMRALNTGFDAAQLKGLVHKKSYINGEEREAVKAYQRWLESGRTGTFTLKYVQGSGLVFGVREGRNWTFYLQENALLDIIRFVKVDDVWVGDTGIHKFYDDSDTDHNKPYTVTKTETRTARKLGPITLPKPFDKVKATYSYTAETVESPVRVVEIYPASYKAATSSTLSYAVT